MTSSIAALPATSYLIKAPSTDGKKVTQEQVGVDAGVAAEKQGEIKFLATDGESQDIITIGNLTNAPGNIQLDDSKETPIAQKLKQAFKKHLLGDTETNPAIEFTKEGKQKVLSRSNGASKLLNTVSFGLLKHVPFAKSLVNKSYVEQFNQLQQGGALAEGIEKRSAIENGFEETVVRLATASDKSETFTAGNPIFSFAPVPPQPETSAEPPLESTDANQQPD